MRDKEHQLAEIDRTVAELQQKLKDTLAHREAVVASCDHEWEYAGGYDYAIYKCMYCGDCYVE